MLGCGIALDDGRECMHALSHRGIGNVLRGFRNAADQAVVLLWKETFRYGDIHEHCANQGHRCDSERQFSMRQYAAQARSVGIEQTIEHALGGLVKASAAMRRAAIE